MKLLDAVSLVLPPVYLHSLVVLPMTLQNMCRQNAHDSTNLKLSTQMAPPVRGLAQNVLYPKPTV